MINNKNNCIKSFLEKVRDNKIIDIDSQVKFSLIKNLYPLLAKSILFLK